MRAPILLIAFGLCIGLSAQDIQYVKELAKELSSAQMKGRGYVEGGLQRATQRISTEFQELGLEPVAGSFTQSFTHAVNTFPGRMEVKIEDKVLVPGKEYIVNPSSPSNQGVYRARIYDANNLWDVPVPELIQEECSDCILVFDLTSTDDKETLKRAQQMMEMYSNRLPIIKLSHDKFTWSVSDHQTEYPILEMHQGYLVDGAFVTLDIEAELVPKFQSDNVMAQVRGTQEPDSFLVFIAHYDHLGMMGSEACFFGANDNASGVAVMLSLAKAIAEEPLPYTALFVAFAGEEAGLLGSKYFVENAPLDLDRIELLINMDLMGSGVEGIMVVNGKDNPEVMEILQIENQVNEYLPKVGVRGQAANSDHYYFAEAGVPAVFVYALGGSSAYHDIFDVYENLTFEEYPDIFQLLMHLIITY